MNYNIQTITFFDRQAKRLAKKYPSLKKDLARLVSSLADNPLQVVPLATIFIKYVSRFHQKARVNQAGQGL